MIVTLGSFCKLAKMTEGRMACSAAALDGQLFVSGGESVSTDSDGSKSTSIRRSLYRFEFQQKRWTKLSRMNKKRSQHTLLSFQDRLYAIGGHSRTKAIEQYVPARNQWYKMPVGLLTLDTAHAAALDGVIYVCGEKTFQMIDLRTETSRELPAPLNVRANSLVSYNGKILANGGCLAGKDVPTMMVQQFDPRNRSWLRMMDMDCVRKRHCSVVVDY